MIAGDPHQGGATWAVLQYVLGLRCLGHDVYLVEPVAASSLRPGGATFLTSINAAYFRAVAARFDLTDRATMLLQDTHETVGVTYPDLLDRIRDSDLLINISGMLTDPGLFEAVRRRVYLDLDPAFNQLWHAVENIDMRFDGHTHFVTVGTLIGSSTCDVPTCGRQWIPTLQPVVLSEWPTAPGAPNGAWTTVGNWRGYGSIEYHGRLFGQKAHSLRRFIALPQRTTEPFLLALSIHRDETADLAALAANGWTLGDPCDMAGTPDAYRAFIQGSKGEFGIAKSGYVAASCGWFSDRSVCYLASGRPVLAQDTGLAGVLPTGAGLFVFSSEEDVLAALDTINSNYARCARSARELAESCFDSRRVLARLLDRVAA